MAGRIDQEVLRLDISMHHVLPVDVVEGPHQLVGIKLYQERVDLLPKLLETLLNAIDVGGDVVHHDVKLARIFVACVKEGVLDPDYVLVVHLFMDLQLTALVLLVLLKLLDCDYQATLGKSAHIDNCKGPMAALDLR